MKVEEGEETLKLRESVDERKDFLSGLEEFTETCWISLDIEDDEIIAEIKPRDNTAISKLRKEIEIEVA